MLGVELECTPDASRGFMNALRLFALVENWGGVGAPAQRSALMPPSVPQRGRTAVGIGDSLVCLAIAREPAGELRKQPNVALTVGNSP